MIGSSLSRRGHDSLRPLGGNTSVPAAAPSGYPENRAVTDRRSSPSLRAGGRGIGPARPRSIAGEHRRGKGGATCVFFARSPRARWGSLASYSSLLFAWLIASWIVDLLAVYLTFGSLGVLLGIVLAPIVFVIAPWYAGLAHGFWWPLIREYGGLIVLALLFFLTEKLLGAPD